MVSLPEPVPPAEAAGTTVPPARTPATAAPAARRLLRRHIVVAPPPSAEVALVARAAEVRRARAGCPPARWLLPGFARDVDLVRQQLGPLCDRRMLVASYERESVRLAALRRFATDPSSPPLPLDPLEAAYAVRWLELTDGGVALPPWSALVGAEADTPA
jgi:hypothetical protein